MKTRYATLLAFFSATCFAAPATYKADPDHTHPSFEADHLGGLSVWRGMFKQTSGVIVLDKETKSGTVDFTVNPASIEFGNPKLSAHVAGPDMLDTAKYPTATYKGKLVDFVDGAPRAVDGMFTLHGVTKPLRLKIDSFKCMMHPAYKREICGADASGAFRRDDFGVDYGKAYGFKQDVILHIQVEALKQD
jgi:polyisoprenoid-binding protein YceI